MGYGGAIRLSLKSDGQHKRCPSWLHNSSLIVEDTRFERNAGEFGGAIYLINGNAIFRNCSFIDNFASVQGGHIYTEDGSTSLDVPLVNSNITLDSITFSKQKPSLSSFVYVDLKNGHQNLWLQNVTVIYKSPDTFSGQDILTVRSHSIAISVNKSLFSS